MQSEIIVSYAKQARSHHRHYHGIHCRLCCRTAESAFSRQLAWGSSLIRTDDHFFINTNYFVFRSTDHFVFLLTDHFIILLKLHPSSSIKQYLSRPKNRSTGSLRHGLSKMSGGLRCNQ